MITKIDVGNQSLKERIYSFEEIKKRPGIYRAHNISSDFRFIVWSESSEASYGNIIQLDLNTQKIYFPVSHSWNTHKFIETHETITLTFEN